MQSTDLAPGVPNQNPLSRGGRQFAGWLTGGWQLFRRAPLGLIGLVILPVAVETLIQSYIPAVGIPLSKWIVGMIGGVFWVALHQLDQCGRLQLASAFGRVGRQWPSLAGLALVLLLVYVTQIAVGYLVIGPATVDLLILGDSTTAAALGKFQSALILSAGVPLSTLLMFAAPLLLIEKLPLTQALRGSFRMVARNAMAICWLAVTTAVVVFLAPATWLLSVLLAGPWLLCVGYAAFRSMHPLPEAEVCR